MPHLPCVHEDVCKIAPMNFVLSVCLSVSLSPPPSLPLAVPASLSVNTQSLIMIAQVCAKHGT